MYINKSKINEWQQNHWNNIECFTWLIFFIDAMQYCYNVNITKIIYYVIYCKLLCYVCCIEYISLPKLKSGIQTALYNSPYQGTILEIWLINWKQKVFCKINVWRVFFFSYFVLNFYQGKWIKTNWFSNNAGDNLEWIFCRY